MPSVGHSSEGDHPTTVVCRIEGPQQAGQAARAPDGSGELDLEGLDPGAVDLDKMSRAAGTTIDLSRVLDFARAQGYRQKGSPA